MNNNSSQSHEKHQYSSEPNHPKHADTIKNEENVHIDKKKKKKHYNVILWIIVVILFFAWIGSNWLWSVLVFAPLVWIRLYSSRKDYKSTFMQRLKNYKQYKWRVWFSIIFGLIWLIMIMGTIAQVTAKDPEVTINSWEEVNLWTNTGYNLNLSIDQFDKLYINSIEVKTEWKSYTRTFNLSNKTWDKITIKAINWLKETIKIITITRSLNTQEIEDLKKREKEQKKLAEEQQRQADIEKKKQEAYMKTPAYKAEQDQAFKVKLNKIMEEKQSDLKFSCTEWVKSLLKSPSSADFPSILEFAYAILNNQILVQSYVDSQNSFGAQIRTTFTCFFKVWANDSLSLVDVKFAE